MTEYEFTLRFALPGVDADPEVHVAALEACGCDDALIGIGKPGRIALEFARKAASAEAAMGSALADVRRAVPDARLIEAGPDLVGLTEISDLAGCSRQNLRKLSMNDATFPTAVHEGNPELFHLADVLAWLQGSGRAKVTARELEIAETTRQVNLAKQVGSLRTRSALFMRLATGGRR